MKRKIIGLFVCMLLIISMLPAIGAFSTEKIEEYSKKNEFHTISMTATCDMFAFDTFSFHLSRLWLMGPNQEVTFFALNNVTLIVDDEIVDVDTPMTIGFWGFRGLAVSPIKFWLYNILIEELEIFDINVYGVCNSIDFVPPIYYP